MRGAVCTVVLLLINDYKYSPCPLCFSLLHPRPFPIFCRPFMAFSLDLIHALLDPSHPGSLDPPLDLLVLLKLTTVNVFALLFAAAYLKV
jgi:hypothetical protein